MKCKCMNSLIDVVVTFALIFSPKFDKILVGKVRDRPSSSDSFIGSKASILMYVTSVFLNKRWKKRPRLVNYFALLFEPS